MLWPHNTSASGLLVHVYFSQDVPREMVIRGALSDGYRWVFIVLRLNEDGKGGVFWMTGDIDLGSGFDELERVNVIDPGPDIVAAILAYWVRRHCLYVERCSQRCCRRSAAMTTSMRMTGFTTVTVWLNRGRAGWDPVDRVFVYRREVFETLVLSLHFILASSVVVTFVGYSRFNQLLRVIMNPRIPGRPCNQPRLLGLEQRARDY